MKRYKVIKPLKLYVPEEITLDVGSTFTAEALFVLHFEDITGNSYESSNLSEYLEEIV